jgi:hypothetical protein
VHGRTSTAQLDQDRSDGLQHPRGLAVAAALVLVAAIVVLVLLPYRSPATVTPGGPATAQPAAGPPSEAWPGPDNTGVPAGTQLEPYTGLCDIRANGFVIDSKIVDCKGILIYATGVVIRKSKINGPIRTNSSEASVLIEDSEVDGRQAQSEAVGYDHVTVLRSNIYGNQHTVHCGNDCRVEDSWLHDQYDGAAMGWHQNGFITNGGSDITLRGNRIECVGGCTADIALIPDDDISNVLVERNLLVASPDSSFCVYAGGPTDGKAGKSSKIVFRDNVFQRGANGKCALYGPVTSFKEGPTNVWSGNVWEGGVPLPAAF